MQRLAFETTHEGRPPEPERPSAPEVLTASTPAPEGSPPVDISRVTEADMTPCDRWDEIMEEFRKLNPAVAGSLEGSRAAVYKNVFFIFTPNRFFMSLFKSQKENAVALSRAIFNIMGSKYRLSARCTTTEAEQQSMAEKLINKARNSNIETAVDNIAPTN